MGYRVRFVTTLEWDICDAHVKLYGDCATPEEFIKCQEFLLDGIQSLEDFVANAVINKGRWVVETDSSVEDKGEWNGV
jgi:hypothetical protein